MIVLVDKLITVGGIIRESAKVTNKLLILQVTNKLLILLDRLAI